MNSWNAKSRSGHCRQLDAPLVSHSIPFSYADAGELQKAAEKLLSPKGSLSVDKRTNRLLIRDNQAVLDTLQHWATQMDIPVEQVELAAHIVTINEKSLRELGVKWNLADARRRARSATHNAWQRFFRGKHHHPCGF